MRVLFPALLLALLLGGCGDPNQGEVLSVVEGSVTRVLETGQREIPGAGPALFQRLEIVLEGSLYRGDLVTVEWGGPRALNESGLLSPGDRVLLTVTRDGEERRYAIQEVVRLPALAPLAVLLVIALVGIARLKGLAALAGLAASLAVFLLAIVPAVRRGDDPLFATLIGSVAVVIAAVFVVHGLNRKSLAALGGTLAGLVAVGGLGMLGLSLARITGFASEEAIFLSVATGGSVDIARLALAGLMVGSLGALVDMGVGQASTTMELATVDPELRGRALYVSALNVGRDHIGSLINTLAFAYFGGALPLILLLSIGYTPLSVAINSEEIVLAILTVVVASVGLVLCVPVTTACAVYLLRRRFAG